MCVGAMPTPPTDVKTNTLLGKSLQGMIQRLDSDSRKLSIFLDSGRRHDHIVGVRESRIVDLQNEPCVDNCLVLMFDCVGQSEKILLVCRVVFVVEEVFQPSRGKHAHEG